MSCRPDTRDMAQVTSFSLADSNNYRKYYPFGKFRETWNVFPQWEKIPSEETKIRNSKESG